MPDRRKWHVHVRPCCCGHYRNPDCAGHYVDYYDGRDAWRRAVHFSSGTEAHKEARRLRKLFREGG